MLMSSKINVLRIHWWLLTILKATKKCNVFWYVKVCIFWNVFNVYSIGYTLRQNTNVETISFGQNKWYKKMSFFFFHEFHLITILLLICDSYMTCTTSFVSLKLWVGLSIFNSISFLLTFIFLFNKMRGLFDFRTS